MTDRYENIRRALALLDSVDVYERALGHATLRDQCHPDTIRALLKERDALEKDAARLEFWFSPDAKVVDINEYMKGIREKWSVDQWRNYIDAAIDEAMEKEVSND